jgi:Na+-translocating ferredoxin:NAD+ oxidoreductase RnfA subunit
LVFLEASEVNVIRNVSRAKGRANMNLSVAATLVAVSALIVYFLMRFLLPTLNFERLLLLGSLTVIAIFLMFMDRRQKLRKKVETATVS